MAIKKYQTVSMPVKILFPNRVVTGEKKYEFIEDVHTNLGLENVSKALHQAPDNRNYWVLECTARYTAHGANRTDLTRRIEKVVEKYTGVFIEDGKTTTVIEKCACWRCLPPEVASQLHPKIGDYNLEPHEWRALAREGIRGLALTRVSEEEVDAFVQPIFGVINALMPKTEAEV